MSLTVRTFAWIVAVLACTSCRPSAGGSDPREAAAAARPAAIVPILMLDVAGKAITKDGSTQGVLTIIEEHDGTLTNLGYEDSVTSPVALEVHGEISVNLPKKSYQLELVDERRDDRAMPLLGLPAGSDWVLHGCGFDPVCLRNVLAYTLGRQLGHYAPRTRFVELFMDGEYHGLYVLIERVRRDRDRVNLPRPAKTASEGDITGGYIFKTDLAEGSPADRVPRDWVSPVTPTIYSYYYPRYDEITTAQKAYLHDHMARFERLMRSSGWNDERTGYRQWLDMRSWVDFALIQELSVNPDAYFKSVYLQKWPRSMGNKIAVGPLWDFDIAFGASDFRDAGDTRAWAHTMNRFGGQPVPYQPPGEVPYVPQYWERLWSDPAFHDDLRCRWTELRKDALNTTALEATLDDWFTQLRPALLRDRARWPNLPKKPFQGGVEFLKAFLRERIAWMDANLPGTCAA